MTVCLHPAVSVFSFKDSFVIPESNHGEYSRAFFYSACLLLVLQYYFLLSHILSVLRYLMYLFFSSCLWDKERDGLVFVNVMINNAEICLYYQT